ncbi:MAG: TAT-variant-translocated molybdopterin oxidoreductase [Acidobacteriota bacterium]
MRRERQRGGAGDAPSQWRSLERLTGSPPPGERPGDEFPEGAAEPPGGLTRRDILHLLGASFALAGLASCRRPVEAIVPYVSAPEDLIPGVPRRYATTMPLGTGAYGLLVESRDGRPTKVEGNEAHPSSRGVASCWMQASILDLYDPDRSPRVLHRPRPGGWARESTWEDFLGFWSRIRGTAEASGGEGLAVLTGSYASPTLSGLIGRLMDRFPRARVVVYDPIGDENVYEGLRRATGEALRPVYHLERARTILALDADLLLTESEGLAHARGFAAARRLCGESAGMSRLYAVESALSLTGAAADHRLRLQSRRIPAFLAALALRLRDLGVPIGVPERLPVPSLPEEARSRLGVIARDLGASGRAALVLAGRSQPPEVHALVYALNRALGSLGRTVSLRPLRDTGWGGASGLGDLVEAMRRRDISTLIILSGNPAFTAPADLEFSDALGRVRHTVHLSTHVDETSRLVEWHLPRSHFLESWGDARAADGSASVIQPLIAPLFDSRSPIELLGILLSGEEVGGYRLVRETWLEGILAATDFETRWNRVLHDGVLENSALPAVTPAPRAGAAREALAAAAAPCAARGAGGMEIVFQASAAVYDGRFANNGWLQELPDPITKITWGNAALLSPRTAAALGLRSGEVVGLRLGGRRIQAPVLVAPGQADESIAIALGYGRSAAGRVGDGVGVSAYLLRHSRAPYCDGGLRIERTGRFVRLAQTQEHWEMEGRSPAREATLDEYRSSPHFASAEDAAPEPRPLWEGHDYGSGYQWGMSIDLNLCIGCNACITACQSENNVPIVGREQVLRGREMHWLRVDRYFTGGAEEPGVVFQPVPCMHCENAPCEAVCPVAATVHDREGINAQVYNRCIGTRYCSNNCAYKVRRFNFFNYTRELPELVRMAMNPDVTVRSRGVMEKCTYCIQRINRAKREARGEGRAVRDGALKTACQQTCPAEAIVFGDVNDPQSRVSRMKRHDRTYTLLAHLDTRPRTTYLARLRNPNPEWEVA